MKRITGFLLMIVLLFLAGCEKDEICLKENTPNLIIRFYDFDNPDDYKKVTKLKVIVEGVDGDYKNESISLLTDSIAIPIKVGEDLTKYTLVLKGADEDETDDNPDEFQLVYTREDVYVSRSCGFKTIFHDAVVHLEPDADNWIRSIKAMTEPLNIENEQSKHVKIFH
jgi:hypothetical protein